MSASGSKKVIVFSLLANLGIAVAKLSGALFTGSTALLAEGIHSLSDCGNQALLLYGRHAAARPADAKYPLGRSKEAFFWSFVVALLLFSMGGMFSIYEGLHKIAHPEPVQHPVVGLVILLVAIVLEGGSFWACMKEVARQNRFGSLWQWVKRTTSADVLVIFLEDLAALLGLVLGMAALTMAWITGASFWDGAGSVAIGVLLIVVAAILAREVKSLLIGEAPAADYEAEIKVLLQEAMPGAALLRFIALQQGLDSVLVAYKVRPPEGMASLEAAIVRVNEFEARVKQRFPEIVWQFAELDSED